MSMELALNNNNNNICKKRKRKTNGKNKSGKMSFFSLKDVSNFFADCLFFMENNRSNTEEKCHTIDVIEKMGLHKNEIDELFESAKKMINQSYYILELCRDVTNNKDYIIGEFNKGNMIFKKHEKMIDSIGKSITQKIENEEEIDAETIDFFCKQIIRLVWFFREGKKQLLVNLLESVDTLKERINELMRIIYIEICDERNGNYQSLINEKYRQINNVYDEEKKIILTSSPIIRISYYRDYNITDKLFDNSANVEKNKKYLKIKNSMININNLLKKYHSANNMKIMKEFNMNKFKHSISNLEKLSKIFDGNNKVIDKMKEYRDIYLESMMINEDLMKFVGKIDFVDYYHKKNIKESLIYVDKHLNCHQEIVPRSYRLQMFYKIKRFHDEDLICNKYFVKYSDEYRKNNSDFLEFHHIEDINEKYIERNCEKNIEMYLIVKNPSKDQLISLLYYVRSMKNIDNILKSNNVQKKDYIIPYNIDLVCQAPKLFLLKMDVNFTFDCTNEFNFLNRTIGNCEKLCTCSNYSDKMLIEMLHQHEVVQHELLKTNFLSMCLVKEGHEIPFVRMDPNGKNKIENDIYPMCYLPIFFKEINPSSNAMVIDENIDFDGLRSRFTEIYKYTALDSFENEGYHIIKNVIKFNGKISKNGGHVNTIIDEKIYTPAVFSKSKIMIDALSHYISYPNLITIDDSSRQRTFYDMRYRKLNSYHHYIHFQQDEYDPEKVINFQKINNNIKIGKVNIFFSEYDIELQLLNDMNVLSNALPQYSQTLFMSKYWDDVNSEYVYFNVYKSNDNHKVNTHIDLELLADDNERINIAKIMEMIVDLYNKSMELLGYNILSHLYQDFLDNVSYSRKDGCYSIDFASNILVHRGNSKSKKIMDLMKQDNIDFNHCILFILCSLLMECKRQTTGFSISDNSILNINNNMLSYSGMYCFSFFRHLNKGKMENNESNTSLSCDEFKQMMDKTIFKYDFLSHEYSLWKIIQKFSNIYRIFFSSTFRRITIQLDKGYTIEDYENISLIDYFNAISLNGNILKRNEPKKINNAFFLDLYKYKLIDIVERKIRKSEGYGLDSTIISNLFSKVLKKIVLKKDNNGYIILFKDFYMNCNESWRIMILFILQIKERLINIRHVNFPIHPIYIIYIYAKSDLIDRSYIDEFHEIFAYIQLLYCNSPFHSSSISSNFIQELLFDNSMTFQEKTLQYNEMIEDYILTNIKMINKVKKQCIFLYNCIFNPGEDSNFNYSLGVPLYDFLHILMKEIPLTIFYKTFFVPFVDFRRKDIMKLLTFEHKVEYKYEINVDGTKKRKTINMKKITLKWLKSLDDYSFKKLVFNITGSTYIGPNDKIHFYFNQDLNLNSLPQYQVCINSIYMPEYMLLFDKDDGINSVLDNTVLTMNKKILSSFEYDNFDIV